MKCGLCFVLIEQKVWQINIGAEFESAYIQFEKDKIYSSQIKARDLWSNILKMQIKKGMPFILFMDACNSKSNQKHSGVIRCSNLCCEITEVTNNQEVASCTLGSLSLNKCVEFDALSGNSRFNFDKLEKLYRELVRNLNNVIDRNFYPDDIPEIKYSNMKHRPLGIGVQGLADTFALLDIPWIVPNTNRTRDEPEDAFVTCPKAKKLNDQIFETIYFASVKESIEQAKIHGHYPAFPGSPASEGKFQFDLWEENKRGSSNATKRATKRSREEFAERPRSRYSSDQWNSLRQDMMKFGLRNSLLTTIMPTASSAHILGNMEAAEPFYRTYLCSNSIKWSISNY